ncbi:MAG: hypothetical protein ACPGGD_02785, partial [Thalassolituus sp.]
LCLLTFASKVFPIKYPITIPTTTPTIIDTGSMITVWIYCDLNSCAIYDVLHYFTVPLLHGYIENVCQNLDGKE